MKISKKQLKQIIKEELTKESSDHRLASAAASAGSIAGGLRKGLLTPESAADRIEKEVKKALYDFIRQDRELSEDANEEQARLQQGASARRFEQDLDALIDDALDRGIPNQDIAEILKMFAGSV